MAASDCAAHPLALWAIFTFVASITREVTLPAHLSRRALGGTALTLLAGQRLASAAEPSEIRIDWATYNPVSIVLKEQGLLEQEFAKDKIGVRWVQSLGSNKALEFLNAGSIDFGSTAGAAALIGKINGNPIRSVYVYSRPGMDRSGHHEGQPDPGGRRPQGPAHRGDARHRPAHLPGARAGDRRADRARREAGAAAAPRWPHRARARRRRRMGRPGPDDGRRGSGERRAAVLPERWRRTPGAC